MATIDPAAAREERAHGAASRTTRPGRFSRGMMRRLLVTALLGTVVAVGGSASAEAPSALNTADGVLFQTCVKHPVAYETTPGSGNWSLNLSSTRSDGAVGPSVILLSAMDDQPSGTTTLDFCGYADTAGVYVPGNYTLVGELSWIDEGGVTHTEQLPPAAFTMARPQTRTTLTVSDRTPKLGQPFRFRVKVEAQSPTGWMRVPDDALPLRLRLLGRGPGDKTFTPLRDAKGVYDYGGTWSRKFRWLGTMAWVQFKAETRGNALLAESTSKAVRVSTA